MKRTRLFLMAAFLMLALTAHSQKVKPGNVVYFAEIEITLEDDMTFEQFERWYLEEYLPAILKNFPGTKGFLLKGERGERIRKYTEVLIFKSLEERNKWFPEEKKPTEEAKKAFDNMREIQDKMKKMCTGYTYTHYVVL